MLYMRETGPRPRISRELAERIDAVRGDVPFERWVRRALESALNDGAVHDGGRSVVRPVDEPAASSRTPRVSSQPGPSEAEVADEIWGRGPVPRQAGFNIGPKPFAKPIPKGK
jgi:hypothetical protein